MTISQEIKNLQDLVKSLLTTDARLRDCDRKLSARVWATQLGGLDELKKGSAYDFLVLYSAANTELFSQESIGRARRLIQETNPNLRGENWEKRQGEAENVKKIIREK